jgi:uncharacterized protein YlaN (UPF0358 family)
MGDRDKKFENQSWENQPSRQGLGLLQDIVGIPNSAYLSKGDLLLKQQERIAKAQESIADHLSNADYRTIAVAPDNTEVMAKIEDKIVDGLRNAMGSFAEMSYSREEDLRSLEAQFSQHSQNSQEELKRIRNISQNVADGISHLNENVAGINSSLDHLSETIPRGFDSLTEIGQNQTQLLSKISDSVKIHGKNSETLLRGIAKLIIEQARQVHEEGELTRIEIREAVSRATTQIVSGLFHIQQTMAQGFDRIKDTIDQNTQRISRGLNGVRDSIDFGSYEIKKSVDLNTQAIDRNTREISQKIADQTSAIQFNAENSEKIKAKQYKIQGRELYRKEHFQEALNRLKIAFSLYNTDFETNYLLHKIYIKLKDKESADKHLALAKSFSIYNQNNAAQSLIEFAKVGDFNLASQSAAHLLKELDLISLDKTTFKELTAEIKQILPFLKQQSQNESLPSISLLSLSTILFEANTELDFARKLLLKGYKSDAKIRAFASQSNYSAIIKYLGSILGIHIVRIKRFGEFSLEIRSLIK